MKKCLFVSILCGIRRRLGLAFATAAAAVAPPLCFFCRRGRTARAGAGGSAVTLVGERDQERFAGIEDFLGKPVRREEIPSEFGSRRGGAAALFFLPASAQSQAESVSEPYYSRPLQHAVYRSAFCRGALARGCPMVCFRGFSGHAPCPTAQTRATNRIPRVFLRGGRGKGKPQPPADSAKD